MNPFDDMWANPRELDKYGLKIPMSKDMWYRLNAFGLKNPETDAFMGKLPRNAFEVVSKGRPTLPFPGLANLLKGVFSRNAWVPPGLEELLYKLQIEEARKRGMI